MFPTRAKGNISEIVEKMRAIGFAPVTGEYDFEFLWTKSPEIDEIVALGNNVQKALKDTGVMFKLETVPNKAFL